MYEEFLKQIEDFIFVEDLPEKADIIFVPGNGYPPMAEKAAELLREEDKIRQMFVTTAL